jgi:hypothetical protein
MSDKQLQRFTEYVADIDHVSIRCPLPGRRSHYMFVVRVRGANCNELIGLYDVIARLMSIALQNGFPP